MKIKDLYEDTVNEAGLKSLLKLLAPSEATQKKLWVAGSVGGIGAINGLGADIQDRNNKRFADHKIKKEKEKSGYPGSKPIAKDPRKDAYGPLGESGVGRIVKGVNTTVDVGPGEIRKQAAKFGNIVSNDGVPTNIKNKY